MPGDSSIQQDKELREELRGGSEARHLADRLTPDGKERVEMIPLDWAIEVIQARDKELERKARLDEHHLIEGAQLAFTFETFKKWIQERVKELSS